MRTEPSEKALNRDNAAYRQLTINKITRIVAIVVAFVSTFAFIFKILFF